jgi:hypothetical protein
MPLWGTPEWMWKRYEVSSLIFVSISISFMQDFSRLNYIEGRFFFILIVAQGTIIYRRPDLRLKVLLYNIAGVP